LGLAHRTFVQIKGTKNFPNLQNIKLFLPSPRVRATNDDNEKTAPRLEHTCFLRLFAFSPTEKIAPKRKMSPNYLVYFINCFIFADETVA
jgi:hypothetical protein